MIIKCFTDSDFLGTTLIGFAPIKVSSILLNSEKKETDTSDWFSLFKDNERVGHVLVRGEFTQAPGRLGMGIKKKKEPADFRYLDTIKRSERL